MLITSEKDLYYLFEEYYVKCLRFSKSIGRWNLRRNYGNYLFTLGIWILRQYEPQISTTTSKVNIEKNEKNNKTTENEPKTRNMAPKKEHVS